MIVPWATSASSRCATPLTKPPWFFAPSADYGLHVTPRREWRGGGFWRMLADELRKAPHAPADRRRAWREVS